jgi:nicotinamidase-related amidase
MRFLAGLCLLVSAAAVDLPVRSRVDVTPSRLALVICDMWDRHWCTPAAERTGQLAVKAAPVIDLLRSRGVLIIHAPSDTMDFYKNYPQRRRILTIPATAPPAARDISDPPLPIDDSDGGCDKANNELPVNFRAWTRQHSAIRIADEDLISDNGKEIYSALAQRGISNLLVMGVHANMCILNRSFAIRQMTKWGVKCVLIRDLTDAMYNPLRAPFVSHERGTQLVIEHIEKYWAPTITSEALVQALKPPNGSPAGQ